MDSVSSFVAFVTLDYIVVFSVWIIVSFLALRGLNAVLYALLLSVPLALLVFEYAPSTRWVGESLASFIEQPTGALAVIGGLVFVFSVSIFRLVSTWDADSGSLFQAAVFGAASTAALITLWQITPHTELLWDFSAHIDAVFNTAHALWLLIGSFAIMTVFRR